MWNGHRRETCRLSDGRVDGVTAVWHRVDAIFTRLKFGKGWKSRRVTDLQVDHI